MFDGGRCDIDIWLVAACEAGEVRCCGGGGARGGGGTDIWLVAAYDAVGGWRGPEWKDAAGGTGGASGAGGGG